MGPLPFKFNRPRLRTEPILTLPCWVPMLIAGAAANNPGARAGRGRLIWLILVRRRSFLTHRLPARTWQTRLLPISRGSFLIGCCWQIVPAALLPGLLARAPPPTENDSDRRRNRNPETLVDAAQSQGAFYHPRGEEITC